MKEFLIGTARSRPGTIQYGRWEALTHPTGHVEFLPVIIAQGQEAGPCIWLTAGIHGPEHAGPWVLYQLLTEELVGQLRGTIVAIPALNPAGLRTLQRYPYHAQSDPNRMWPDGKPPQPADPDDESPSSLEMAYGRLFTEMVASANYLIDYHNAWIGSISFAFRDRIFYQTGENEAQNRAEAEALLAQQEAMLAAYGHTVVTEFPAEKVVKKKLHRSTSAAAVLLGKIPAFTVELGTGPVPDPAIVAAAVAGTRNVLRWAGMLGGEMEAITGVKVVDPGFPVRRRNAPKVDQPCLAFQLRQSGDLVQAGEVLAELRDVWGRPIGDGFIRSDYDGFVLGRSTGIYYYPGESVYTLAIRDELPLVAPYPTE